jgi:hypothetical protein
MKNILPKELKLKFIEILNQVEEFVYEEGNPFLIKVRSLQYFVFLKNISSAYFPNSPDVTRVQLPTSSHFADISNSPIPFIILGYDIDNDVFVCWNPYKIKERLNAKSNVSLYSRESLQSTVNFSEFKEGYLSNGEKIILFDRENLPVFFEKLPNLFDVSEKLKIASEPKKVVLPKKLFEITDSTLLSQIMPMLAKNRVLEAVEACSGFYGDKYKDMSFKDWFKIVENLYQKSNAVTK